ncbi:cytochrome P450 [Nocardia sp. R16R-3T]
MLSPGWPRCPAPYTRRFRDKALPVGAMLLVCLVAAHRDPALSPNPDKFDPDC